jgi:hypothetical protein
VLRGRRGLVADNVAAGQCDDAVVYRAMDLVSSGLGMGPWCRSTSDRFPKDCRAPRGGSIHELRVGADDGGTGEPPCAIHYWQ